jgi:hypothetical protein
MRSLVALLAASGVALVVVASGAEAEPFAGGPHPQTVARSFRAVEQGPALVVLVSWEEPESLAIRQGARVSRRPFIVERNGVTYDAPGLPGEVARRTFAARPDAHSFLEELTAFSDFVLARARAGKRRLAAGTTAGEASWTTSSRLPANDCAGRAAARITLSLSRETLLPLRVRERVRRDVNTFRWTYSAVNDDLPASEFATPRLGARPFRVDRGPRRARRPASRTRRNFRRRSRRASTSRWRGGRRGRKGRERRDRSRGGASSSPPSSGAASSGSTSRSASPVVGAGRAIPSPSSAEANTRSGR